MANTKKTVKPKIVKCRYGHCLHETKELNAEDAVKIGNAYYHKDCNQTKEEIKKIADIFVERVNRNVVFPVLMKTINNIVFDKGIGSEFLLFALNSYLNKNKPLNYPGGLYYIIQNAEIQREYKLLQEKKMHEEQFRIQKEAAAEAFTIDSSNSNGNTFTYKPTKQKGFDAIFGK